MGLKVPGLGYRQGLADNARDISWGNYVPSNYTSPSLNANNHYAVGIYRQKSPSDQDCPEGCMCVSGKCVPASKY